MVDRHIVMNFTTHSRISVTYIAICRLARVSVIVVSYDDIL